MKKLIGDAIPEPLRHISQPPKHLYIVGDLPPESYILLTVVGSRDHTTYGKDVCIQLLEGLAGYPIAIVSGLASGIDTIAHETALRVGLKVVCFPGSGLDPKVLFPRKNVELAEKILESGGCLISEFEPMQVSADWTFPMRNRLMAGIAKATLIIEAKTRSGTLITADLALGYNKEVLAVPGQINSSNSVGTNLLIKQGAKPITRSEDILEALGFNIEHTPIATQARIKEIKNCSPEEKKVLETLIEPLERDELSRRLNKPIHEVNMTLTVMELKGLIKEEYGEIRRI